ncbi:MAG: 2-C-methyl-D-erythritol 2,4-cyclodiphosphate synthase [Phycisphaerales bacterium]|nr:2-C-methyl-D-erythritol 2,4-cyclodiphosphate synthase [Phycisphaerales bacterium]
MARATPPWRIGHGFDLHRLEPIAPAGEGRPLIIGGIRIEHDLGPVGHSDGDALLHAVTDAILGALGEPDIGELFPDTSPKWEGADSTIFLEEAVSRMSTAGYELGNLDATIILQKPKIAPHKDAIRSRLAQQLGIEADRVNLKGKTHEKLDALGAGRGIAVHAVALLVKKGTLEHDR